MGDITYLDEFDILSGFKFIQAYETVAECSDGTTDIVTIMTFANDKNVAIDLTIIDGELKLCEPYAVDDSFEPLNKKSK